MYPTMFSVRSHKIIQKPSGLIAGADGRMAMTAKETRSRAARQLVKYKILGDNFELMNNSSVVGCVFARWRENTRKYTRPVTLKSHNFHEISRTIYRLHKKSIEMFV